MIPTGLHVQRPVIRRGLRRSARTSTRRAKTLSDAGVKTPVPLEIWYTPSHYGASSGDEYAEIKRQLDDSGLFDVTLKSTEWNQYSEAAFTDKYPIYQLGWFPDYPDADDYVGNFYSNTSFLNIHYDNPEMQKLLAQEKASTDDVDSPAGVRQDPADRRAGRADDPDLGGRPGRRRARRRPGSRGHVRSLVHLPVLAAQQVRLTPEEVQPKWPARARRRPLRREAYESAPRRVGAFI